MRCLAKSPQSWKVSRDASYKNPFPKGFSVKRILYVEGCRDGTVGGSHSCLFSMVANLDRQRFYPIVIFYDNHNIAVRLRGLGIETHIFKKYSPLDIRLLLENVTPLLGKISLLFLPLQKTANFVWTFLWPALLYSSYLKKNSIDIVHLNNSIKGNHEWTLAAKIAGMKVLTHERGFSKNLPIIIRFLVNRLDAVICITRLIYSGLLHEGVPKARLKMIYDGVDPSNLRVKENKIPIRKKYGIESNDPIIGVVGNIKEWKGQEIVVRATAILKRTWPGIKCLLVGGVIEGDSYKKKLEGIIQELNIGQNVIFTGFQNNPGDLMNVMDVVVHSSIKPEPFGMVNLEAMYLKKPVVSTKCGGPTEVIADGENGFLIDHGDPFLLANKLSFILRENGLRDRIGENAYEFVTKNLMISNTVKEVMEVYEDIDRGI